MIKSVWSVFCVFVAMYAAFAFVSLEPNPANWDEEWRAVVVFASAIAGLVVEAIRNKIA